MAKKIDPLNKKNYGAVMVMLTVGDVKSAVSFYQRGVRLCRAGHHERPRWRTNSC